MGRYVLHPVWSKIDAMMSEQLAGFVNTTDIRQKIDMIDVATRTRRVMFAPQTIEIWHHYSYIQNRCLDVKVSIGPGSYNGLELVGLTYRSDQNGTNFGIHAQTARRLSRIL